MQIKEIKTIKDTFKIDFSKIDNSLEQALLPFNDAYIMSKVSEKIKTQGYAKIEGTFANVPINLFFKPMNSTTIEVSGKVGENEINAYVMLTESNANPDLKKQVFLKNVKDLSMINSQYNETHDQWGFQKLSSVLLANPKLTKLDINGLIKSGNYSQLTITYNPETDESFYKVKQNCTCTKELVRATYISKTPEYDEQVETKLSVDVTTDLKVEGKIKQDDNEWLINYQIS